MRKWRYIYPASEDNPCAVKMQSADDPPEDIWVGVVTMSEHDILLDFYPHWCALMRKAGKGHLISESACIEDWVVVHWAEEVKDE